MISSSQAQQPGGLQRKSWVPLTMIPKGGDEPSRPVVGLGPTIRLLLVDDHPVVIYGLRSCLAKYPRLNIVGCATDGQEAVRKAKELSAEVVLMDITMPNMGGFVATAIMQRENPKVKVLILTVYNCPEYLVRIMRSGARGYVLKSAPPEDLVRAIETVYAGETIFSSEVSQRALSRAIPGARQGSQASNLTNREREILLAVAEGLTNKEIASRLGVEPRTVETHRERMARKLDIHSIAGLTRFAVQTGLLPIPVETESIA